MTDDTFIRLYVWLTNQSIFDLATLAGLFYGVISVLQGLLLGIIERISTRRVRKRLDEHINLIKEFEKGRETSINIELVEGDRATLDILAKAIEVYNERRLDFALQLLQEVVKGLSPNPVLAAVHGILGDLSDDIDGPAAARSHFEKALQLAEYLEDNEKRVYFLDRLAHAELSLGNIDEAYAFSRKGLEISEDIGYGYGRLSHLINIAAVYGTKGEFDRAIKKLDEAIALPGKSEEQKANIYALRGQLFFDQGDFQKALESHKKAVDIFRITNNLRGELQNTIAIAKFKTLKGEYDDALGDLSGALQISRRHGFSAEELAALTELGYLYTCSNNHDDALRVYDQALILCNKGHYARNRAVCLFQMGHVLSNKGDYGSALDFYKESLEIFRNIEDVIKIGELLVNMGGSLILKGDIENGVETVNEGLEIARSHQMLQPEVVGLYYIAISHHKKGEIAEAKTYINEAMEKAEIAGMEQFVRTIKDFARKELGSR